MKDVLLNELKHLSLLGNIRPIDYQFSRFIYTQLSNNQDEVSFLAGLLSIELGKGNVCLPIFDNKGITKQFIHTVARLFEHNADLVKKVEGIDWREILASNALVGTGQHAVPIIFDGYRLYMQRYWQYETVLVDKLQALSMPVTLDSERLVNLSNVLNELFCRNYSYLFKALSEERKQGNLSIPTTQRLVCDYLDVVDTDSIDWQAVDGVCQQAQSPEGLSELDILVTKQVCADWQKIAASIALTRKLAVISGGPGTGKTTTVTKLLLALAAQAKHNNEQPIIKLAAPTGKAAARLTESVGKALASIHFDESLKAVVPTESSTIHRLLGAIPNSVKFQHDRSNPLKVDVLVIDEASMVDLSMMYRIIEALPDNARLILLGDKDQLSSVEAGSVLGDICQFLKHGYSSVQAKSIAALTHHHIASHSSALPVISDSLCMLQKSYRFDIRSGIGQLAKAINKGHFEELEKVYQNDFRDIVQFSVNKTNLNQMIRTIVEKYRDYLKPIEESSEHTGNVLELARLSLDAFSRCRLLCALREGDYGVSGLNQKIEQGLEARKLIYVKGEQWYHGRPVMVTRNDHNLGLYNGDIGICIFDGERLRVFFELPDGTIKLSFQVEYQSMKRRMP